MAETSEEFDLARLKESLREYIGAYGKDAAIAVISQSLAENGFRIEPTGEPGVVSWHKPETNSRLKITFAR